MRDVIDQLESYQAHLDTLYPPVTAAELERTATETPGALRWWANPRVLRPLAFAAGFAVMAVVGLVIFVGGDPTDPDVAVTSPPVEETSISTTVPDTSTPPVSQTTTSDTSAATTAPSTAVPPVPEPLAGFGNDLNAVVDQSGRLVLAYWSADDMATKLVICADPQCLTRSELALESPVAPSPVEGEIEPSSLDLALRADGTPFIVESRPEWNSPAVHACADQECSAVTSSDFGIAADFPQAAIGGDGLARIAYFDRFSSPRQLKLAICGDAACAAESRETLTLDSGVDGGGEPSLEIDAIGRVLVGYETTGSRGMMEARVAVCGDDRCKDITILRFEDAVAPRTVAAADGAIRVWYRSGPLFIGEGDLDVAGMLDAWQLMVVDCGSDQCGRPVAVDVGWGVLLSWPGDVMRTGDAEFLIANAYWSPFHCSPVIDVTSVDLNGIEPVAVTTTYSNAGWEAALVTLDGSPALIHDTGDGGLAIVEISPSTPGTPVRERC